MTEKILSDRLDVILVEVRIKNNFSDALINNLQYDVDGIYSLEERITVLEGELENKDLIIREHVNLIVTLANSLKNIIFERYNLHIHLFKIKNEMGNEVYWKTRQILDMSDPFHVFLFTICPLPQSFSSESQQV